MNVFDSTDSDSHPPPTAATSGRSRERLTSPGLRTSLQTAPDASPLATPTDPWEPTVPALVEALLALDPALLKEGRPAELPPPPPWSELSSSLQIVAELYATVSPTLDPHSRTAARRFIAALRTVADTVSPRGLRASSTEALWTVLATLRGEPSPIVMRRLGARAADVEAIWAPLRAMLVDLEHVDLDVIERVLSAAAPLVVDALSNPSGRRSPPCGAPSAQVTADYTGDGVMITLRSPSGEVASTFGRTAASRRDRPLSTLLSAATATPPTTSEPKARIRSAVLVSHPDGSVQETLFDALGIADSDVAPDASTRRAERRAALRGLAPTDAAPAPPREALSKDTRAWLRRVERSPIPARLQSACRVAMDLSSFIATDADLPPSSTRSLADVELLLLEVDGTPTLLAVCLTDVATDSRARRAAAVWRPALEAWRRALSSALGLTTLGTELCFPMGPLAIRL